MPTKVALHLNNLICAVETEHGSEPYLWPIVIGEENGTAHMAKPAPEWMGRVLAPEVMAGQTVPVPPGLSAGLTHSFTNPANALVVMVVVLTDRDSSLQKGTVAVLQHIEDQALAYVQSHLVECRTSSGERTDLANGLIETLAVDSAEVGALTYRERWDIYLTPDGFDDSIGLAMFAFSGANIRDRDFVFNLSGHSEQWSLSASLQVTSFLIRCQAQRTERDRALAVVKSLHHRRAMLQTSLQTATPQQKSVIIAQITHIAEVELPPAEAALATAEAALAACLAPFDTHGPLGGTVGR